MTCVLLGRTTVGCPTRVGDTVVAGDRLGADHVLETGELAGAPPHLDLALADQGDSRRIVAAVLESS